MFRKFEVFEKRYYILLGKQYDRNSEQKKEWEKKFGKKLAFTDLFLNCLQICSWARLKPGTQQLHSGPPHGSQKLKYLGHPPLSVSRHMRRNCIKRERAGMQNGIVIWDASITSSSLSCGTTAWSVLLELRVMMFVCIQELWMCLENSTQTGFNYSFSSSAITGHSPLLTVKV